MLHDLKIIGFTLIILSEWNFRTNVINFQPTIINKNSEDHLILNCSLLINEINIHNYCTIYKFVRMNIKTYYCNCTSAILQLLFRTCLPLRALILYDIRLFHSKVAPTKPMKWFSPIDRWKWNFLWLYIFNSKLFRNFLKTYLNHLKE